MILADKIIQFRKKNGWSQEELPEMLNVSRQSVSKWEGALSVPDLDKIIKLSQIFSVSTDYLLKDEIEIPDGEYMDTYDEPDRIHVSLEEATTYMSLVEITSRKIANAVSVCILSPIPLILFGGMSELQNSSISEDFAGGLGVVILLIMIACAVSVFIKTGIEMSKFEYLSKEIFELEYGVSGAVESKKTKFEKTFSRGITIGVVLCILSLIPMFTAAAFQAPDFVFIICINILLAAVSIAVNIFIRVGSVQDSYNQLLQTGDFTEEGKQTEKFTEKIAGAYWLIVTAVYLACSFYTSDWNKTWIIWPCAGVLFGAIAAIAGIIQSNRQNIK